MPHTDVLAATTYPRGQLNCLAAKEKQNEHLRPLQIHATGVLSQNALAARRPDRLFLIISVFADDVPKRNTSRTACRRETEELDVMRSHDLCYVTYGPLFEPRGLCVLPDGESIITLELEKTPVGNFGMRERDLELATAAEGNTELALDLSALDVGLGQLLCSARDQGIGGGATTLSPALACVHHGPEERHLRPSIMARDVMGGSHAPEDGLVAKPLPQIRASSSQLSYGSPGERLWEPVGGRGEPRQGITGIGLVSRNIPCTRPGPELGVMMQPCAKSPRAWGTTASVVLSQPEDVLCTQST
ncbi:hypothetical protein F4802DRAFT_617563 [Xylaria palmicola]|nr:hypothetical protein F4802DRAFT_617563 [Xylaria palmicola]